MADFRQAFKITMKHEGGYANDPHDSGGETYKGVARNYWPKWIGWKIIDRIKQEKGKDTKTINLYGAKDPFLQKHILDFYEANFWSNINLDQLKSQAVANQLFDLGVNMGAGKAATFLQKAIRPTVLVDGKVGPKTIAGANAMDERALYNNILALRKAKYDAIIAANPAQAKFKKSWYSRLTPFEKAVVV